MQNNYFWSLLAHDEKARANRFHAEIHRRCFISARGILRHLAGQLLQQVPETLQFSYNCHGKPVLRDYPGVQFNLSHSCDQAIYAFVLNAPVGVDIEYQNSLCNMAGIAQRFFTRREYATLQELEETEKKSFFFKLWVRKEAMLKALGTGLSNRALSEIEFDLKKGELYLSTGCNRIVNPAEWSLHDLDLDQDFAAALAIQAHPQSIQVLSIDSTSLQVSRATHCA